MVKKGSKSQHTKSTMDQDKINRKKKTAGILSLFETVYYEYGSIKINEAVEILSKFKNESINPWSNTKLTNTYALQIFNILMEDSNLSKVGDNIDVSTLFLKYPESSFYFSIKSKNKTKVKIKNYYDTLTSLLNCNPNSIPDNIESGEIYYFILDYLEESTISDIISKMKEYNKLSSEDKGIKRIDSQNLLLSFGLMLISMAAIVKPTPEMNLSVLRLFIVFGLIFGIFLIIFLVISDLKSQNNINSIFEYLLIIILTITFSVASFGILFIIGNYSVISFFISFTLFIANLLDYLDTKSIFDKKSRLDKASLMILNKFKQNPHTQYFFSYEGKFFSFKRLIYQYRTFFHTDLINAIQTYTPLTEKVSLIRIERRENLISLFLGPIIIGLLLSLLSGFNPFIDTSNVKQSIKHLNFNSFVIPAGVFGVAIALVMISAVSILKLNSQKLIVYWIQYLKEKDPL